jgi:hypothetical protein
LCYLINFGERKPSGIDVLVISALIDFSIHVKADAEIILYGGELFVCHFNEAATENVNFVLLHFIKELQGLLVEHSALDHSAITVDQVKIHDVAFALVISPLSNWRLFYNSGLDAPILAELI